MIAKIFAVGSVAAMFLSGCCDIRASCEDCSKYEEKSAAVQKWTLIRSQNGKRHKKAVRLGADVKQKETLMSLFSF